jgi:hypothetical protein
MTIICLRVSYVKKNEEKNLFCILKVTKERELRIPSTGF